MPTSKRLMAPLIVMFAVIISMVAFSGPANAAYGDPPSSSVSDQTPVAGASLEFCGSGFQAGETVTITLSDGTEFPSAVADSNGDFCTTLVLGASLSGTFTLTATGTTSGTTSSTEIVVAGASASGGTTSGGTTSSGTTGGLAFTGAAVAGIGVLGGLLLIGGAAMVVAGRRRKINA